MTDVFSAPHFRDDSAAREELERIMWPDGPICPHCGVINHAYATKREGVYRCAEKGCRKDFTVTMRTVMERSKIALHKWLQAFALMTASKKGISAHQLHRMLDIGYEAAWFMAHRIREAMRLGGLSPMGGPGGIVEVDETYIGTVEGEGGKKAARSRRRRRQGGWTHKNAVLTLVERGGRARSFHIDGKAISDIMPIVRENVARENAVMTDEAKHYYDVGDEFASHHTVKHSEEEYVRHEAWIEGDKLHIEPIHTNTVEGFYSIFKRGMKGIYQHCSEKHLHRYLAEYDFRYSHRVALGYNDGERKTLAIKNAVGKRLTYRGRH
ncbi:MAG TPA: IS1595 family transposase [Xanthobacteraceae bacterium]|nr:IS1595 family transposase [Xanthobacteraceae bacterium]